MHNVLRRRWRLFLRLQSSIGLGRILYRKHYCRFYCLLCLGNECSRWTQIICEDFQLLFQSNICKKESDLLLETYLRYCTIITNLFRFSPIYGCKYLDWIFAYISHHILFDPLCQVSINEAQYSIYNEMVHFCFDFCLENIGWKVHDRYCVSTILMYLILKCKI